MSSPDLSREEENLYNRAFTALLLFRAVQGYESECDEPCPLTLAMLAGAMALHPKIRQAMPKTSAASVMGWVEENRQVRLHLQQDAPFVGPVLQAGLLFALQSRVLSIQSARLSGSESPARKTIPAGSSDEAVDIQKRAYFLGKWLPKGGTESTILTLLGVRP